MKISLDDKELLTFSDIQRRIYNNEISSESFHKWMSERIKYAFKDHFDQCFRNLRNEWEPKLVARGHEMLPVRPEIFAQLVFDQPDYRDKFQRDTETKAEQEARTALQNELQNQEFRLKETSSVEVM